MLLIALIDKVIPKTENPHEIQKVEALQVEIDHTKKVNTLRRTGLFMALAIAIHNFPEGLATFMSALENPEVAIPITIAIAIHNIPEGIAVSVPIYYATGNRKKAFLYSFISGLSEPLGAITGFFILLPLMSKMLMGIVFAAVAGIMVFISLDELLPASREYGEHHLSIYGLIAGMVIMSVSLLLFL
jgi:ZIP family zinc transporter